MRSSIIRTLSLTFLTLTVMFLLSGCTPKPPAENEISETFTEEFLLQITEHSINGVPEQFSLENVVLERRQTNEKTDTSDCIISLSNANYTCEINVTLIYEYFDQGGWYLEDWEINNTKINPLVGVPDDMIAYAEDELKSIYPDAILASKTSDLVGSTSVPTEVLVYDIPKNFSAIGETGIEIIDSGSIKSIYTFDNIGNGYSWNHIWDDSALTQAWTYYVGTWYPTDSFDTVSLEINDFTPHSIFEGKLDLAIRYDIGYKDTATERITIPLLRCSSGTTLDDILNPEHIIYFSEKYDFSSTECLYYGRFSYQGSDTESSYGVIMFTEDGLLFADEGTWFTDVHGNTYIKYHSISTYY